MDALTMVEEGTHDGGLILGARDQPEPAHRIFGGLLLGQAVAAAAHDADPQARVLSLQSDFIAAVPTTGWNRWLTHELGTGPGVATRRCDLLGTDNQTLFTATVRLGTVRDDLPSYQELRPRQVSPPEELDGLVDRFGGDTRIPPWWRIERPVDLRHVEPPPYTEPIPPASVEQTVWWRPQGSAPPDPTTTAAVVAYTSDMSVIEPVFRRTGSARHRGQSRILSLTHSVAYHAHPPLADWMQMDCRVTRLAHGRALGDVEIFTRAGEHVASARQLAMVKLD